MGYTGLSYGDPFTLKKKKTLLNWNLSFSVSPHTFPCHSHIHIDLPLALEGLEASFTVFIITIVNRINFKNNWSSLTQYSSIDLVPSQLPWACHGDSFTSLCDSQPLLPLSWSILLHSIKFIRSYAFLCCFSAKENYEYFIFFIFIWVSQIT